MCHQLKDRAWFNQCLTNQSLVEKLQKIKLIVTDIDGSLTDGNIAYTDEKELSRRFSILDGFGIAQAQKAGFVVAFISGKKHQSAHVRAEKLKIPEKLCFDGQEAKGDIIAKLQQEYDITDQEVLLFGDDYFDAIVKTKLKNIVFTCPLNAPFYFQTMADLVIPKNAGNHAFRLLLDLLLYIQKKHFAQELIDASLSPVQHES